MARANRTPSTAPSAPAAPPPSAQAQAGSSAPPAAGGPGRVGRVGSIRGNLPDPMAQIIATKVYLNVYTDGPRGSLIAMPLHEIPLMKRKMQIMHQTVNIDPSWPEGVKGDGMPRTRDMTPSDLQSEYERLRAAYTFSLGEDEVQKYNLLADFYGQPHERRLIAIIRRMHEAYEKLRVQHRDDEKNAPWPVPEWESIVALAEPEQDFIDNPA